MVVAKRKRTVLLQLLQVWDIDPWKRPKKIQLYLGNQRRNLLHRWWRGLGWNVGACWVTTITYYKAKEGFITPRALSSLQSVSHSKIGQILPLRINSRYQSFWNLLECRYQAMTAFFAVIVITIHVYLKWRQSNIDTHMTTWFFTTIVIIHASNSFTILSANMLPLFVLIHVLRTCLSWVHTFLLVLVLISWTAVRVHVPFNIE